ncbi:bifunctional diaminohydroxyphosphoribosylaminopyrimidine deaminase/5-amino-6-(5-phosphoribosylamino)uracil reductase RibD [Melioribacteraceae bacterium 4301-Me]|uniref:bifunctional diaminohydroxyphosphoribosylaminopyrimidine deaminase/5-amino-6-(5-phosphoribosylamino)uracil reductase RibD n=1 Tax=Pyranulibacter aquaticus TaxID=3163344 RepID=UPI003596123B
MNKNNNEYYIKKCFELAKKGEGYVSPNPLVGAVIVKNGKIISEGWHEKYGFLHAEASAIYNAKEDLTGSTLYCNLEPCCHTNKKTPPCVPLIIKSGIKRVVISNIDPNPEVNGKGIEQLRATGIEVEVGVSEEEGKFLNKFFFKFIKEKIPYVTLKVAQSTDGKITEEIGKRTQITGQQSQIFVHEQRSKYDAVFVGAGTVNIDNPSLDVRFTKGRNPLRIIIDGKLNANINSRIFEKEKERTWVITSLLNSSDKKDNFKKLGIKLLELPSDKNGVIDLKTVLKKLGEEEITSLFVEGGAQVFNQFYEENLFDEIIILKAPSIFPKGLNAFASLDEKKLKLIEVEKLGVDEKIVYFNSK